MAGSYVRKYRCTHNKILEFEHRNVVAGCPTRNVNISYCTCAQQTVSGIIVHCSPPPVHSSTMTKNDDQGREEKASGTYLVTYSDYLKARCHARTKTDKDAERADHRDGDHLKEGEGNTHGSHVEKLPNCRPYPVANTHNSEDLKLQPDQ